MFSKSGAIRAPCGTAMVADNLSGVNCIKGEVHSILTLIRLHTRWASSSSSSSVLSTSSYRSASYAAIIDGAATAGYYADGDPIVQGFHRLNEYLENLYDLWVVDCISYLLPFYEVIVSDKASGPLTSSALSSLSKFLLYGFLAPDYPRVTEGIGLIASAISLCVFEETDWESDELILMKLLQLSTLCFRCEASALLTTASAWDIFSTCTSIHSHYRASKILRTEAENALVNITLSVFSRAPLIAAQAAAAAVLHSTDWEAVKNQYKLSSAPGLMLLMWKIMTVLSDMLDTQQAAAANVSATATAAAAAAGNLRFALRLINVALEAGGTALSGIKPLALILGSDISRHLLRASQSDDLAVLSATLRVVLNLFTTTKQNMKVQLEVFLISVHLRLINAGDNIISSSSSNMHTAVAVNGGSAGTATAAAVALAAAKEELALESLLEFCREPALMADIYANYDCDVQCTNLFESIMNVLCARAIPSVLHQMGFTSKSQLHKQQQHQQASKVRATNATGLNNNNSSNSNSNAPVQSAPATPSVPKSPSTGLFLSPSKQNRSHSSSNSVTSGLFGAVVDVSAAAQIKRSSGQGFSASVAASTVTGREYVKLSILNRLSLDGLLAVLRSIAARCVVLHVSTADIATAAATSTTTADAVAALTEKKQSLPYTAASSEFENDENAFDVVSLGSAHSAEQTATATAVDSSRSVVLSLQHPDSSRQHWNEVRRLQANSGSGHDALAAAVSAATDDLASTATTPWSHLDIAATSSSAAAAAAAVSSVASTASGVSPSCNHSSYQNSEQASPVNELSHRARRAEMLRRQKARKQKIKLAADCFNSKPLKPEWILQAIDLELLQPSKTQQRLIPNATGTTIEVLSVEQQQQQQEEELLGPGGVTAEAVAEFLKNTPLLGKTQVGEYISKGPADLFPFNAAVLRSYVDTFDFSGESAAFDRALRLFLGSFKLPGEAQCIDRLMEAFAGRLFHFVSNNNNNSSDSSSGRVFASQDAVFILSFSTIMLNTDLHNPNIPANKKMTKLQFVRNNRGINDGADIPREYLESLYDEIQARQIQVDVDVNDSILSMDFCDTKMWKILLERGSTDQAPADFTPNSFRRNSSSGSVIGSGTSSNGSGGETNAFNCAVTTAAAAAATTAAAPVGQLNATNQRQQQPLSLHPSFHEREMFLTLSSAALESLVLLWEHASDDYLVSRVYQGLWDYITICIELRLKSLLSKTMELLAYRSRLLLAAGRALPTHPYSGGNVLAERTAFKQWKADTGHNLQHLVMLDFEELVHEHVYTASTTTESIAVAITGAITAAGGRGGSDVSRRNARPTSSANWAEASMIKGELAVKMIFQMAIRSPNCLSQSAWSAVISMLLWSRSRGVLPTALALTSYDVTDGIHNRNNNSHISSDISSNCNSNTTSKSSSTDSVSSELLPSVYARECFLRAYGLVFESLHYGKLRSNVNATRGHSHSSNTLNSSSSGQGHTGIVGQTTAFGIHSTAATANTTAASMTASTALPSAASAQEASWMSSIGGFLWSATANPVESNPISAQAASSHAASQLYALQARQQQQQQNHQFPQQQQQQRQRQQGGLLFGGGSGIASSMFLEVPDIYRNLNAGLLVDVHGNPLRPDDELLKLCLRSCQPAEIFYIALSGGSSGSSCYSSRLHNNSCSNSSRSSGGNGVCTAANETDVAGNAANDVFDNLLRALLSKLISTINKMHVPTSAGGQQMATGKLFPSGLDFSSHWDRLLEDRRRNRNHSIAEDSSISISASISTIGFGEDAVVDVDIDADADEVVATFPEQLLGTDDDLEYFLNAFTNRHHQNSSSNSSGRGVAAQQQNLIGGVTSNSSAAGVELDCVALLEWISMMLFSNQKVLGKYWAIVFEHLKVTLDENIDVFAMQCPYFLERCVFMILRAAYQMFTNTFATSATAAATGSRGAGDAVGERQQELLWASLKLLRTISSDFSIHIADQIGFMLLEMIRRSTSTALAALSLEQWYLLFSILTTAAEGAGGRQYAWQALDFIVLNDLVTDKNFSPCRQLLLRFIQNSFAHSSGEDQRCITAASNSDNNTASNSNSSSGAAAVKKTKSFVLPAMTHLMRLTLMVLAGYSKRVNNSDNGVFSRDRSSSEALKATEPVAFPLPAAYGENHPITESIAVQSTSSNAVSVPPPSHQTKAAASAVESTAAAAVTDTANATNNSRPALGPTSISISCVFLSRSTDEAEMSFLESGKVFADLCNSHYLKTSIRAVYSLKAIIMAANTVAAPFDLWVQLLGELVERLPISLITAGNRLGLSPATSSVEIMQCCQRSCSVVFDIFITHVADLRTRRDFRSIWVRFVSVLSTNAQATHRGAVHDDTCGMLEALLRLLRKPTEATYAELLSTDAGIGTGSGISNNLLNANSTNSNFSKSAMNSLASSQTSTTARSTTLATSSGNSGVGGFFNWLVGSEPTGVALVQQQQRQQQLQQLPSSMPSSQLKSPTAGSSIKPPCNTAAAANDYSGEEAIGAQAQFDHDGPLLLQTWKTICSLYPSFPSYLKQNNQQLMNVIANAVAVEERAQARIQQLADRAARFARDERTPSTGNTPNRSTTSNATVSTTATVATASEASVAESLGPSIDFAAALEIVDRPPALNIPDRINTEAASVEKRLPAATLFTGEAILNTPQHSLLSAPSPLHMDGVDDEEAQRQKALNNVHHIPESSFLSPPSIKNTNHVRSNPSTSYVVASTLQSAAAPTQIRSVGNDQRTSTTGAQSQLQLQPHSIANLMLQNSKRQASLSSAAYSAAISLSGVLESPSSANSVNLERSIDTQSNISSGLGSIQSYYEIVDRQQWANDRSMHQMKEKRQSQVAVTTSASHNGTSTVSMSKPTATKGSSRGSSSKQKINSVVQIV